MIKSFYLRLFFLGLPGLYLALWLSRFSLSMVNAMPYYYGMIMTAFSLFSGILIGVIIRKPFSNFFKKHGLQFLLLSYIFLNAGHLLDFMDAGVNADYEIIYYFSGLCLTGVIFSVCMQHEITQERNTVLCAFVIGSVLSYFIGVKYFEQSNLDIFLGIPVFIIFLLYHIFILRNCKFTETATLILLVLINIALNITVHIKTGDTSDKLTNIGYAELKVTKNSFYITDHRQRKISDIKENALKNLPDFVAYQLQTNKSSNRVLFIGYPGSISPLFLYQSPFIDKVDLYFWDITTPKGMLKQNIFPYNFYLSEWNFFKRLKITQYDLIIIESIPEESRSSQRIFLHYSKRLLKNPHGVIVYPESIASKYDGQYIKINPESNLVMLMGSESTENTAILEERYSKFIDEKTNIPPGYRTANNLPNKIISEFDSSNSAQSHSDIEIFTAYPPSFIKFILWAGLGLYLVFRLFKCRYNNNQSKFFAFEAGATFCIIIFSSLMLLSELRLVYPYFPPALFGIACMVMMPVNGKKKSFVMHCALFLLLTYFMSVNFVRAFPPIYVIPILLPLSFIATANTLFNCRIKNCNCISNSQNILFFSGVLLTLLLLLCAKNNNLYPSLVYIATISRLLFYLKI